MRVAALFLLAVGTILAQVTHPHVTEVKTNFDDVQIVITTREFADDEQPAPGPVKSWSLQVEKATMYAEGHARQFEEDEQKMVIARLKEMREAVETVTGTSVQSIRLVVEDARIELAVWDQPAGLWVPWVIQKDEIVLPADRARLLSYREFAPVIGFLRGLLQYCHDSVEWWRAGQGKPVSEAQLGNQTLVLAVRGGRLRP